MYGNTRWWRIGPCTLAAGLELLGGEQRYHMSIAHPRRLPTWDEIKEAKQVAEREGAIDAARTYVMPFPPRSAWLSIHPFCFHLWELRSDEIACDWATEAAIAPWRTR